MVGDGVLITGARSDALRQQDGGFTWISRGMVTSPAS